MAGAGEWVPGSSPGTGPAGAVRHREPRFHDRFPRGTPNEVLIAYLRLCPDYLEAVALYEEALQRGNLDAAKRVAAECMRQYSFPPICLACSRAPNAAAKRVGLAQPVLLMLTPPGRSDEMAWRHLTMSPGALAKGVEPQVSDLRGACPHLLGQLEDTSGTLNAEELSWLWPYLPLLIDARAKRGVVHQQVDAVLDAFAAQAKREAVSGTLYLKARQLREDLHLYEVLEGLDADGRPVQGGRKSFAWVAKDSGKPQTAVREAYRRACFRIHGRHDARRPRADQGTRPSRRSGKIGHEIAVERKSEKVMPDRQTWDLAEDFRSVLAKAPNEQVAAARLAEGYPGVTPRTVVPALVAALLGQGMGQAAILKALPLRFRKQARATLRAVSRES